MRLSFILIPLCAGGALGRLLSSSGGWPLTDWDRILGMTGKEPSTAATDDRSRGLARRVPADSEATSTCTCVSDTTMTLPTTYHHNVLYSHNIHRANHSSPDLIWSQNLQASAQKLAARCSYEHNTYDHPLRQRQHLLRPL
jgi:hypothetical protein